jgi:tRNA pseudouridine55 synthase
MFGFIVINKPSGISSRAALNQVEKLVRPAKIGHAGTLDPLATGVLVACVGPATRLVSYVQQQPKSYRAGFRLGVESETEDIESELVPVTDAAIVVESDLRTVLPDFTGAINQLPPRYSALRINGQRAYQLARDGQEVVLKPRPVEVHSVSLTQFNYPDFELEIVCGSGTYVRSLGRDIGRAVGSGAVMTRLKRTAVGGFTISHPGTPSSDDISARLISPASGLSQLHSVLVDDSQIAGFLNGVAIRLDDQLVARGLAADAQGVEFSAIDSFERLIAVLQRQPDGTFTPKINFAHYWRDVDALKKP